VKLTVDEQKTLKILLCSVQLEGDSNVVSKARRGQFPCERLKKEITDPDSFELELSTRPNEEVRDILAKLAVYAKVVDDLCGLQLAESFEPAAAKLRSESLVPSLVQHRRSTFPQTETAASEVPPVEDSSRAKVEELFQRLRHEAYEPIRQETIRLLKELDPLIFADRKVEKIAERLIRRNLDEQFNRRHMIAHKYAPLSELRSFEEFRGIEEYVLRENMEYWVKHWALEEIAENLKADEQKSNHRQPSV
jgi:hypothetical protein